VNLQGTWPYMSALLLKYAKKPNELADDQESVVYVLTECLLRWHPHTLSHFRADDDIPLALWNVQRGEKLRNFVSSLFFEEIPLKEGYMGGGTEKLKQIEIGAPSFQLIIPARNVRAQLLNELFTGLYRLLKKHYDAVNLSTLERFFVPEDAKGVAEAEQYWNDIDEANHQVPPFDEDVAIVDTQEDDHQHQPSAPQSGTQPSATASTVMQPALPRVLDSHKAMLELFERYLYEPNQLGRRQLRLAPKANQSDKTEDQFAGFYQRRIGSTLNGSKRSHRSDVWESVTDSYSN
jgi:hypothetical protein